MSTSSISASNWLMSTVSIDVYSLVYFVVNSVEHIVLVNQDSMWVLQLM